MTVQDDLQLRFRWLTSVTAIYWVALAVMIHMPPESLDVPPSLMHRLHADKLFHFGSYGLLAVLLAGIMELHAELRGAMSKWSRTAGTVFVAVAAYGGLDELTQPLTNRTCDPWDFAADVVGAALGLFLYRRFLREHFIGPSGAADDRALELKR